MWYYIFIIFCEIVLCLLNSEEHEIEEKCMCFKKCFLEFMKKKNVSNNFYEKWDKNLFFGTILKREKRWCRLMVKAFLLLSGKMVPYELDTPIVWWRYNDIII